MNNRFLLAAAILGFGLAGCHESKPSLTNPGTVQQQQARANRFDPYPVPDPGLPSMAGTRPREYQNPPSEPMRVGPTWDKWNPPCAAAGGPAGAPVPGAYPAAPYPPTGQYAPSSAAAQAGSYAPRAYSGNPQSAAQAQPSGQYSPAGYSATSQPIPESATQPAIPYSGAVPATPTGR